MMIGVYAKKQNGDLVNVGMLSQAEVATLNLVDEVTGDKKAIPIEEVKNIDKIRKSAFVKLNGEKGFCERVKVQRAICLPLCYPKILKR